MYKIIGTDQRKYGPVTADHINQWIAQGRVNALTKAFLLILLFGTAVFLPASARAQVPIDCMNNARLLNISLHLYAVSHSNHLPLASVWCDAVSPYTDSTNIFQCENHNERCGFAFNTNLSGANIIMADARTVLLFESDGGWNAYGGLEQALRHSRHGGTVVVAYANGDVEAVAPERLGQLRWNP